MLQFVDIDTYKKSLINPERAFLLYVDEEHKISLQADIELGGDPVNYRVELMDFELDTRKPILLTTVECRGFYCGGISFSIINIKRGYFMMFFITRYTNCKYFSKCAILGNML